MDHTHTHTKKRATSSRGSRDRSLDAEPLRRGICTFFFFFFCVGGRDASPSCMSLEQHVVQSSADGCQDTVGLVILSARLSSKMWRRGEGRREVGREREKKKEKKKRLQLARTHRVSDVINRPFASATAVSRFAPRQSSKHRLENVKQEIEVQQAWRISHPLSLRVVLHDCLRFLLHPFSLSLSFLLCELKSQVSGSARLGSAWHGSARVAVPQRR